MSTHTEALLATRVISKDITRNSRNSSGHRTSVSEKLIKEVHTIQDGESGEEDHDSNVWRTGESDIPNMWTKDYIGLYSQVTPAEPKMSEVLMTIIYQNSTQQLGFYTDLQGHSFLCARMFTKVKNCYPFLFIAIDFSYDAF